MIHSNAVIILHIFYYFYLIFLCSYTFKYTLDVITRFYLIKWKTKLMNVSFAKKN